MGIVQSVAVNSSGGILADASVPVDTRKTMLSGPNRLGFNVLAIVMLIATMCGLAGLQEQKEAIKAQSRPHWVTFTGGK